MKRTVCALAAGLLILGCNQQDKKTETPATTTAVTAPAGTTITWIDSTVQDLGKVTEGAQVEITYRFKNTGSNPLVITDVRAGCGCTIPEKPTEPVAPGQEGKIRATFNSENRVGPNHKQITVDANTSPRSTLLDFKVEVLAKKQ